MENDLPQFEDKHPGHNAQGYSCTNEEPELMREMLAATGRTFERGGAIASSGEVTMFSLLPFCQQMVCIDHSYRSLANFYTKIATLKQIGVTEMLRLMEKNDHATLLQHAEAAYKALLPEPLKAAQPWEGVTLTASWSSPYKTPTFSAVDFTDIRREWYFQYRFFSDQAFRDLLVKAKDLKLIHGDIMDLAAHGPYDLMYVSNALEHDGRNGKQKPVDWVPMLRDNALVVVVRASGLFPQPPAGMKLLEQRRGFRTTWDYYLWQKVAAETATQAADAA